MTETIELTFVAIAILLIFSVVASKLSDRYGIPALLLFLAIGMLAGSEGIGGIYFDNAAIAQAVGLVSLVIILFSGGLDAEWSHMRGVIKESLSLATVGVLVTAGIVGFVAHWVLGITLLEGLLLGAIASPTDAAAVFSLLGARGIRLKGKIMPLLEFESGSNDPMAVFLTIGLIELIGTPSTSPLGLIGLFLQQMIIGAVLGYLFGRLLLYLINRLRLGYEGLYPILVLGMLLLTFGATNLVHGSGFLAVYLVGLVLGQAEFLHKGSMARFYGSLAWLMQIIMFLTLGLLVFPKEMLPVIIPGLILAAVLILIARPISVWISLAPFRFSWREKAFISWVGLRGAVPIVLATFPMLAGLPQSRLIFNVIFFVVLSSVLIQGTSISQAARWLKVKSDEDSGPTFPLVNDVQQGWRGVLKEVEVPENSPAIGKAIFQLGLPRNYLVVMIARGDQFIIPNGSVVLQPKDRLLGLSTVEAHDELMARLRAASKPVLETPQEQGGPT